MTLIYVFFFALVIEGCKSSVQSSNTLSSPIAPNCRIELVQGAAYTPVVFKDAIQAGFHRAIQDSSHSDLLKDFLSDEHLNALSRDEVVRISFLETDPCALTLHINQASKGEVVELISLVGPNSRQWGGLILFGEDLFSQSNFEARTDQFAMPAEFKRNEFKDPLELSRGAAWFKWTGNSFEFQKSGASRRILEILARKNTNFRLLRGAGADSSDQEGILTFKNEQTMFGKYPFSSYQGIFFHISEEEAKKYANPIIAEINASIEDLISLTNSEVPSIFVGFSKRNVDIAIIRNAKNPLTIDLLSTLRPYCSVEAASDRLMFCP
jgi:hypothetical protein